MWRVRRASTFDIRMARAAVRLSPKPWAAAVPSSIMTVTAAWVDLFICNYLDWTPQTNQVCGEPGHRYSCDPTYYPGTASVLYHNNRNGTFTDVTAQAGVAYHNGKALGVVVWDMDGDGWPDL